VNYGGAGRIDGTVTIKGSPNYAVRRRVLLLVDRDGFCLAETWSDPATGAYSFTDVDPAQRYTVLSIDYARNFRVTLADNITPEPM
jgi:hypothetical protein